jgi:hypothetical protein
MFFCRIELGWATLSCFSFVPLNNWEILVFQFKTTHIPFQLDKIDLALCYFTLEGFWFFNSKQLFQLDENFHPLCYLTIERFWFLKSKQLIPLQLHEIFLPLCYFAIEGFWFLDSKQLYFFNSMKFFFLSALLHNWRILVLWFKTTHTSSTPWLFASFVLLHNWGILVLGFKTTHTSSTQWNFSSFVRYFTIEGFWFLDSKQLILLQLNEIFLPLCATSQLKDFGSSIQNNSYFFNSMKFFLPLCATSQLKDFGSWIQNNSYFFNSIKFFFLCALLHNWRILVLGFKTTHTSSKLHEIFLPLRATSQLKDFGSSIQNNSYFFKLNFIVT